MSKVRVNLTSGSSVEKTLVSCFKGSMGKYLILDNGTNGPEGLPIICVSKFDDVNASKIYDPQEWANVKQDLKGIISGNKFEYFTVPDTVTAADEFFTQLSLPVASFDALKNAYVVPGVQVAAEPSAPVMPEAPVVPEVPAPAPALETTPLNVSAPVIPDVTPIPVTPVMPEVQVMPAEPSTPVIPDIPTMGVDLPSIPEVNSTPTFVAPVMPEPTPDPVQATPAPVIPEPVATTLPDLPTFGMENATSTPNEKITDDEIAKIKANFMEACESMFETLINKLKD